MKRTLLTIIFLYILDTNAQTTQSSVIGYSKINDSNIHQISNDTTNRYLIRINPFELVGNIYRFSDFNFKSTWL